MFATLEATLEAAPTRGFVLCSRVINRTEDRHIRSNFSRIRNRGWHGKALHDFINPSRAEAA